MEDDMEIEINNNDTIIKTTVSKKTNKKITLEFPNNIHIDQETLSKKLANILLKSD
ncbi:MAG: hypothetical protein PHH53_03070 [Candidatus Nanoarchaeia archaeon]|jgi:predicted transglutaminase-like protease|nr:hypothetical protein [Candidatus Nanoarchaeia archaeon]